MNDRREKLPPLQPAAGRVPPHDLDAEAAVLSSVLLEPGTLDVVRPLLPPEKMYSDANRRVLEAAIAVADSGTPVDAATIASWLRARERLAHVGGVAYLAQLADATPSVAHVEAHAREVADRADLRSLIALCQRIAAEGYGDVGNIREFISSSLSRFTDLVAQGARGRRGATTAALVHDLLHPPPERSPVRVYTGIRSLDKIAGPLEGGESVLLLAYSGQGKSAFCANIAARVGSVAFMARCARPCRDACGYCAHCKNGCGWTGLNPGLADNVPAGLVHCPMCRRECGCTDRYRLDGCTSYGLVGTVPQGVIVFSHEIKKERYLLRLASMFAGVSAKRVRDIADGTDPACRQETEDDLWTCERVARALRRVESKYIRIIDDCSDIDDIRAETLALRAEWARQGVPTRLLANDYSQRTRTRKRCQSREQEVAYVASTWKNLCMDCDAPGIMPGQLNKDGLKEKREPRARDARESEGLHNEADRVIIVWNPERAQNALRYGEDGQKARGAKPPEVVKLLLDKSREGDTGTACAAFHPTTTSFTDWSQEHGCVDDFDQRWEQAIAEGGTKR